MKKNQNIKIPIVYKDEIILCPNCNSLDIIKVGFRKTQYRGEIQKFKCKNCDKKFTSARHKRFRIPEQVVAYCLKLFSKGYTSRKIQNMAYNKFKIHFCFNNVFRWAKIYSDYISINNDERFVIQLKNLKKIEIERRKNNQIVLDKYFPMTKKMICEALLIGREEGFTKKRVRVLRFGIITRVNRFYFFVNIEELNYWLSKCVLDKQEVK